jgi:hypothetical protein
MTATNYIPAGNPDQEEIDRLMAEYNRLAHAMQTGVGHVMQRDPKSTEPKMLRTGMNSALVSHSALVKLLFRKGVITELEYWTALVEEMRAEVQSYTDQLELMLGGKTKITLV